MGSILHHETLRTAAGKPNPCRGLIQACAQMGYRRLPAPDLTRLYLGPRRVPVWRVRAGSLRTLHTAADSSIWDSVRPRCAAAKWWLRHSGSPTGVAQRVSMALAIACRRWYPHIVTLGNKTLRNGRRPWTPTGRALPAGRGTRKPKMCSLCDLSVGQAGRLLLVQERTSANTPTVTYTRGRDLSGSLAGAGGIGGLLARSHGYSGGNWSSHHAYHADGTGNVTALANSAGALQASYQYDPYGRYLAGGGTLASANVMRFSSKPWVGFAGSATSGLYYYGYRFYDPYLQRWPNRDPLGEDASMVYIAAAIDPRIEPRSAGETAAIIEVVTEPLAAFTRVNLNLYGALGNNPVSNVDPLGLDFGSCYADCIEQHRNPITEQLPKWLGADVPCWFSPALHGGNALGNKLAGPTGRSGFGGVKSHPTSWQHKVGSKFGTIGSRIGKFLGRTAIVVTVLEGFYNIGLLGGCAAACAGE